MFSLSDCRSFGSPKIRGRSWNPALPSKKSGKYRQTARDKRPVVDLNQPVGATMKWGGHSLARKMPRREIFVRLFFTAGLLLFATALIPRASLADEGGVSFWLPGTFGSLAAVPGQPGWSLATFTYNTNVNAGADVAAAREIEIGAISPSLRVNLSATLHADAYFEFVNPTYVFATPFLGGQASVALGGLFGHSSADVNGTLVATVGPLTAVRSSSISSEVTGFGDLLPQAYLKWNAGVHNFMVYGFGDIPVGDYESTRLANLGIGHGAADAGAGYTYFDPATGHEFSAVAGFTYNLENPSTNYQNGVDFHVDWAASQFLSKQLSVGVVGYLYDEIGCDSGSGDHVGCFQSRVVGLGPQVSYLFPIGDLQGYLNLKGYGEFDASDRPSGWNIWLTFAVSPAAQQTPAAAKAPLVYK
jgi:hypothetical protein